MSAHHLTLPVYDRAERVYHRENHDLRLADLPECSPLARVLAVVLSLEEAQTLADRGRAARPATAQWKYSGPGGSCRGTAQRLVGVDGVRSWAEIENNRPSHDRKDRKSTRLNSS